MPIFSTTIGTQNQAGSAGAYSYPDLNQCKQYSQILEEFSRESLNPTNFPQIYTATAASSGTANIVNGGFLRMATAATLNDYESLRTSGLTFARTPSWNALDLRSVINMDILFRISGPLTSIQMFIGLLDTAAAVTALPTTARHMGMYIDTSVNGNWFLSSANGSTQSATDTGIAFDANSRRLNINWTGTDAATITQYTSTNNYANSEASKTVTSLSLSGDFGIEFVIFLKTLNTAAKDVDINEYRVQYL